MPYRGLSRKKHVHVRVRVGEYSIEHRLFDSIITVGTDKRIRRVMYATLYPPDDPHYYSGTGRSIWELLKREYPCVEGNGPIKGKLGWRMFLRKVFKRLLRKSLLIDRNVRFSKRISRQVDEAAKRFLPDLIVSPMSLNVAYVTYPAPIVIWHDTPFGAVLNYYPVFTNLLGETIRAGNKVESDSLHNASLVLYQADWAVDQAHNLYDIPLSKLRCVPYGANFPSDMTRAEVLSAVQSRSASRIELLFVGVLWERKGGDIALEAAKWLHQNGVEVRLRMIGLEPPDGITVPDYVEFLGFISKHTEEGIEILRKLYRDSHFLIMPTRAEAGGMAITESLSFGTPALVTDTGGTSTAAKHGINSMLFRLEDRGEAYAKAALNLWRNQETYVQMCLAAYDDYVARLSWEAAGRGFKAAVRDVLGLE